MVSSDQISTAVGILGNVTALSLFLSPVPTFYRICKKKSVEKFSVIPYVAALLNCLLWVLYGLPIVKLNNTLVLTINAAGAAIELCYIFIYLLYSNGTKRAKALLMLLLVLAFVAVVAAIVLSIYHTRERRTFVIGILCIVFCIMMYVAPLSVMRMVIKTKSVEFMPLGLSVVAFISVVCWTVYAVIKFDANLLIPNVVGVVLCAIQLVLHALYYKSTKRLLAERKMKGEVSISNIVVAVQPL